MTGLDLCLALPDAYRSEFLEFEANGYAMYAVSRYNIQYSNEEKKKKKKKLERNKGSSVAFLVASSLRRRIGFNGVYTV